MKGFWLGVISAVLSGVILLLVANYIGRPGTPDLTLRETSLSIEGAASSVLFWNLTKELGDAVDPEKLKSRFQYRSDLPLGWAFRVLEITNDGAEIYDNIEVRSNGLRKVVVQQGDTAEVFEGDLSGKSIALTPGATAQIIGLREFQYFRDTPFLVTMDKKALSIESLRLDPRDLNYTLISIIQKYSFIAFMVQFIFVSLIFIFAGVVVQAIVDGMKKKKSANDEPPGSDS